MQLRLIGLCLTATVIPAMLSAQSAQPKLTAAQEIAAAVSAAPPELRDGATVLGLRGFNTVKLREGTNDMVCLGPRDDAKLPFQVACYHKGLEPFMARGRSLRAEGVKDPERDSVRFKEISSGKLKMPNTPSALYTLNGGAFDAATNKVNGAKWLYVVYIPGATMSSTGIAEKPAGAAPWIMFPGTPKAHIMFTPTM